MKIVSPTISQPDSDNIRLNSQTPSKLDTACGLDWLDFRGLLSPEQITPLFDWVADHCDDIIDWEKDRPTGRHQKFSHGFRSVRGGIYAYEPTEGAYHVWISLPGQAVAGAGSTMAQLFIAKQCVDAGLRCTRLDLYLDDWTGTLSAVRDRIREAYSKGHHTGFRKMPECIDRPTWDATPKVTLYLGSRESTSFVRIYDKDDRVRWERQTGRDVSDVILGHLLTVHEEHRLKTPLPDYDGFVADAVRSHLTNGIGFVERKDKNLERGTVCAFWTDFLGWLGALQLKVTRSPVTATLERTLSWLNRQVAKSLSIVKDIMGSRYPQWLSGLLENGKARYRSVDEAKIAMSRGAVLIPLAT
jgi:hypothetical protein